MKTWSDEWRCARLQLYLRNEELFQGETVNVQVTADVTPLSSSYKASSTKNPGQKTADQLLQRWREHCEGAQVQIQVVEVSEADPHASSSTPSSTTLFRQETQVSHVSVNQSEDESVPVVKLKAQFDLKVRHEFWNREVLLIVHITPKSSVVGAPGDVSGDEKHGSFKLRGSLGASLLRDEWATSQLLSLTREETQPTPVMTRRVEQHIVVTKPLQLEVETRELATQRVGILARAFNAHSTLALAVRDLQLHLGQSLQQNASGRDASRFRVVSGDKVPFPVVLQPQERYNFLFVLEPVTLEVTTPDESLKGPEGDDNEQANSNTQKKNKSPVARRSTVSSTLLTLSWQAAAVSMDAITENRSIVWSPPRSFSSLSSDDVQGLVTYVQARNMKKGAKPYADFKCERLLPDSALQATVAPLSSIISVGNAVTVCVTVVNRSARTDFDLTLVLPSQNEGISTTPDVVGFEASHRLGLVRPGIRVRRSLHVAFLRLGKCQLGPVVLVDHLTRTCFVSDDWEVFIKN
ncbi:hypothetical protein PI124_g2147 [Phytophthora idaei]|nr:hypothetical protein PI125_g1791 [Phytophthora idaei]KAG3172472.1 hypothetical protein PI126_g1313 [Phytophthora idaei]KAG3253282.1 hypothetical protein PI124_g2147 [Phytophthora idaei]